MARSNIPAGYCDNCGSALMVGMKFCGECGNPVNTNTRVISPEYMATISAPNPPILATPSPATRTKQTVIAYLLTHSHSNPAIASFIENYLMWLDQGAKEKAVRDKSGRIALPRTDFGDGGSYGYDPADVAYGLTKLNSLLFEAMTKGDLKKMVLPIPMIRGFSGRLGYYNFLSCSLDTPYLRDSDLFYHTPTRQVRKDLESLCEVASNFLEIEDNRVYVEYLREKIATLQPDGVTKPQPDAAYWYLKNDNNGYDKWREFEQSIEAISREEKKRLTSFVRSVRQTLEILADEPIIDVVKDEPHSIDVSLWKQVYEDVEYKAWFRESLNECDSLNSQNKMSYGSTRPFIATCFFANCHIDLNHA